jgi:hypothetical protein
MEQVRAVFLDAAGGAVGLLAEPEVARRWDDPSALPEMSVGALAGHLARQVFNVQAALAEPPASEPLIPVLEHYARVSWIDAGLQDEPNVEIRRSSMQEAAAGPAGLVARAAAAAAELREALPAEPGDRVVRLPWAPWSLTLDDLLRTRVLEIVVHGDDLACSVGMSQARLPGQASALAIGLLSQLAARRHGSAAVIRALSRAERAPRSITAF